MNNKLHRIVIAPWKAWGSKQWRLSIPFELLGLRYGVAILVMLTIFRVSAAWAISWTPYPLPPIGNIIGQFNDVIFDGTQFWAVVANGWVQKSLDGATWISVAPGPTYFFYDIAHGGGNQYVVVGQGTTLLGLYTGQTDSGCVPPPSGMVGWWPLD